MADHEMDKKQATLLLEDAVRQENELRLAVLVYAELIREMLGPLRDLAVFAAEIGMVKSDGAGELAPEQLERFAKHLSMLMVKVIAAGGMVSMERKKVFTFLEQLFVKREDTLLGLHKVLSNGLRGAPPLVLRPMSPEYVKKEKEEKVVPGPRAPESKVLTRKLGELFPADLKAKIGAGHG